MRKIINLLSQSCRTLFYGHDVGSHEPSSIWQGTFQKCFLSKGSDKNIYIYLISLSGHMLNTSYGDRNLVETRNQEVSDLFQLKNQDNTRGHRYKIYKNRSRLNIRKNSFCNRIVNIWNSLPSSVVESTP